MFKCTPVFYANQQAKEKVIINQGGTSSSKTYSIVQLLFLLAISKPGLVITITGESLPNLRKGAYRDAETIHANTHDLKAYVKFWNKSDRIITFHNGSMIEFISNLDEQSAKAGKRDYLFVNEANGISWAIFWQLAIRTRNQIFIDYNPSAPFWAHDKLIGTTPDSNDLTATVKLIISDHRHNVFLSEDEHKKIEGIKDPGLWEVYARGKTGNLSGLIYPDHKEIRDGDWPESAEIFGGLDYGYTNDPTAGVKLARVGECIFHHELCYTPGIAPMHIKEIFVANGFTASTKIYSEHDPDQISQLRRLRMSVHPARKGRGSINAGIIKMKEYKHFYTASSKNYAEERKRYMWDKDKITGKPLNTPIDGWNHLMDADRYGVYTHLFSR